MTSLASLFPSGLSFRDPLFLLLLVAVPSPCSPIFSSESRVRSMVRSVVSGTTVRERPANAMRPRRS